MTIDRVKIHDLVLSWPASSPRHRCPGQRKAVVGAGSTIWIVLRCYHAFVYFDDGDPKGSLVLKSASMQAMGKGDKAGDIIRRDRDGRSTLHLQTDEGARK
jgi:hypothetical protein